MPGARIYVEGGGMIGAGDSDQIIDMSSSTSNGSFSGSLPDGGATSSGGGRGLSDGNTGKARLPGEESLIIGQLRDEKGVPLGGEPIIVEWTDEHGEVHRHTTTTLTRDEAIKLGDPSLEGYYFLNKRRLGVSESDQLTVIRASAAEEELAAPAEEEAPPTEEAVEQPEPQQIIERVPVEQENLSTWERFVSGTRDWLASYWYVPLGLLVLILVLIFLYHQASAGVLALLQIRMRGKFGREAKRLAALPIRYFMNKDFISIEPDKNVHELIGKLLQAGATFALVRSQQRVLGIVTAADIIERVEPGKRDIIVTSIMTSPVNAMEADKTFLDMAKLGQRVIVVKKGTRILGVVTRKELLAELDKFLTLNLVDARNMPVVKDVIEGGVNVQSQSTLKQIIATMREQHTDLILVTKEREVKGKAVPELLGVLSEAEIMEELYNFTTIMEKMDAERLMVQQRGIPEGATVFEASKVMIERGTRTIPVVAGSELRGVVTEKALLAAVHQYFLELLETQK